MGGQAKTGFGFFVCCRTVRELAVSMLSLVSDNCTDTRTVSALQQLLEAHKCSAQTGPRHALRSGRKLLHLKNLMDDEDLYAFAIFSGGALYHTPYGELGDLALRLESEQTLKQLAALNKGWFRRARKGYDGMTSHPLSVLRLC